MTRFSKSLWLLAGLFVIPAVTGCNETVPGESAECTESCEGGIHLYCTETNEQRFEECTCDADGVKCVASEQPGNCVESCVNGVHTFCTDNGTSQENCTCAADGVKCESGNNTPVNPNPDTPVIPDNPQHPAATTESCTPLAITGSGACEVTGSG
ncbi:MAG: hypothetical protein J6S69_11515, partial [Proteobacteria bacterium]|nr:hypothetical protein [Pseudomonadota bacterium]